MIYIYALIDPRTSKIRYIGKTMYLKQRLTNQLNEKSNTHRCNWMQNLKKYGLKPNQYVLQTLNDGEDWENAEIRWIFIAKKYGWDLLNGTSGGDGVKNLSAEAKEKMSKTWLGRKHKPESLEKLSLASRGRIKPEKSKDLLSENMKGREIKWKDKLQKANRKFSDEDLIQVVEDLNTMSGIQVAKKWNVHRTTITKIKKVEYKTFKQKTYNYIKPRRFHKKDNL